MSDCPKCVALSVEADAPRFCRDCQDRANGSTPSDCSASPVHMGYYDDKGRFIPADLAKFIDTLNGMTHEQLSVVASQCIHLMCENR